MARVGFATREELRNWADSKSADGEFPRLIRRLALETGRKLKRLDFRAAEGARLGDWDGTLLAGEATAFIPEGLSGWELSVRKNAGAKADEDYEKRTNGPGASPTNECTYVAVSLRTWQKHEEWASDRSKDGRWKAVRALALDDVNTWLEDAPVTHAWFSELLGLEPHGMQTLDRWWTNWSTQTDPVMPPGLMLAGRENAVTDLRQKLASSPQTITISAASRDEVLAFAAAFALAEEAAGQATVLARTAVVDEVTTWRSLLIRGRPLVLIAASDAVIAETGSRQTVHHVIVPVPNGSDADIVLSPIDSTAAAKALEGALKEDDARTVANLARQSLLAARRRIAVKKELLRPAWAQAPVAREVRRHLLANRWSSGHETDRDIVARLVGKSDRDVAEDVVRYSGGADPLLTTVDAAVTVVSPYDAFRLLVGDLTTEDLTEFKPVALEVLGAANPALELPSDRQWQASVLGKSRPHSNDLRQGVANSLALLGTLGGKPIAGTTMSPADWAAWIVRELLERANRIKDVSLWASLNDVLPEIGEAAPAELLKAVAEGLGGDPPLLQSIFIDEEAVGMFAHQTHTGLLWALEICAWSPEHFGQVVEVLARLAEVDHGSPRYTNRPINSLREIFLPWHPQNAVDVKTRLDAIDGLRVRHPKIAWRLMLSMLPETRGIAHGTHAPSYREWRPEEKPILMRDYWAAVRGATERLAADVGQDVEKWIELIGKLDDLPADLRNRLLEKLDSIGKAAKLDEEERARVFETIDELVRRHREFAGEAQWALLLTEVDAMAQVAEGFRPTTPLIARRWLFADHMPTIEAVQRHNNVENYTADLTRLRKEAMAEITATATWTELLDFVHQAKVPDAVGMALSDAEVVKYEAEILKLLGEANWSPELGFAQAYFARQMASQPTRSDQLLQETSLSPRQRARLLLATWNREKEWQALEAEKPEVVEAYWHEFPRFPGQIDIGGLKKITNGLRSVGRVGAALDLLALLLPKEDDRELAELIADSLEHFLKAGGSDKEVNPAEYDFVRLFQYMDRLLAPDRVAGLEWSYLSTLEHSDRSFALHRIMADSPDLFVDLISRIFRPREEPESEDEKKEEPQPEVDEATRRIAMNAYRLLDSWKSLPGNENGKVAAEKLRAWIGRARSELARVKRRRIGDDQIGKVLAHSPAGEDGAWPAEAVRDVLEAIGNKQLDDGFDCEIRNSRGVTSRALDSGGTQERELASRYRAYAERVSGRWPHTASLLRRVAEGYEREAIREDEDAERWRKGIEGPGTGPVVPAKPARQLVLHFAYGSNMSTERLEKRIGKVVQRGVGRLDGFEIRFDKKSADGSGKTNIVDADGGVVWGVLYDLTPEQIKSLAAKEKGYAVQELGIVQGEASPKAGAFVASKRTPGLRPTRTYLGYLLAGAREHKLPADYIAMLEGVPVK